MNYLYNGVELPALPDWDKEMYPYAYICQSWVLSSYYVLRMFKEPYILDGSTRFANFICEDGETFLQCDAKSQSTSWRTVSEIITNSEDDTNELMRENMVWSNFDLVGKDGTLYLAASEPIPVGTAPTIDPLSLFMGWKAGNWVARQRGKAKPPEEEKTPVAFLYNGVRLPDINAVWTDKETYPYSLIYLKDGFACLYLLTSEIFVNENNEVEVKNYGRVAISIMLSIGSGWSDIDERTIVDAYAGQIFCSVADFVYFIWTSHDILNADGTVYLAASEPVSVYE